MYTVFLSGSVPADVACLELRPGFGTRQRVARERETRIECGREEDKGVVGRLEIQWIPTRLLGQTALARARKKPLHVGHVNYREVSAYPKRVR